MERFRPPHRILVHGAGTGDLTDEDVERRARELAVIRGGSEERVTEDDRAAAWAELRGEPMPASSVDDSESRGAVTRDPSEPMADTGRQVADQEGDDDEVAPERLAIEGVEEAQHDQMLASRRREHRRDRR